MFLFFADIRFEATTIQLHLQPLQFDIDGQRAMEVPQGVPREPNLEVPNLRGSGGGQNYSGQPSYDWAQC